MHVVYLDQYFKTPEMVGGTRGYEMMRRLVRRGRRVTAVTTDRSAGASPGWRVSDEDGIEVHWIGIPYSNTMPYRRRLQSFLRYAAASAHRAASIPGDVVLATSTPLTIALPAAWTRWRRGIPMVFEVRDLWPDVPVAIGALRNPLAIRAARALERFAYRRSARIVALSPGMGDGIVRAGYPRDRVTVIPNSSDVDLFRVPPEEGLEWRRRHPEVGDRPMVLYAGTLGRINGVDWLAEVAKEAASIDPAVCFVVVGDGIAAPEVRQAAERLGVLGGNFILLPSMPKREMPAVLSAATICTSVVIDLEALWHNSANKVFDALAAARPIAVNHRGWQAELIEASGAGLVLPVGDVEAAARLLVERVTDGGWVRDAGRAAGRLADERFHRDLLAGQLDDVLRAAAGEGVGA